MKELYDENLVRGFAATLRRTSPKEWSRSRAAVRLRAKKNTQLLTPAAAHVLLPVFAGVLLNAGNLRATMTAAAVPGFTALSVLGAALFVSVALRVVLSARAPREILRLAPVSDSFIAGVEAAMVRRGVWLMLWDVAAAWVMIAMIAACASSGWETETALRGGAAGLVSALPSLMLGFLAAFLRDGWLHRLAIALELMMFGLVVFLGAMLWQSQLDTIAETADWLPQVELARWAAAGGPWPAGATALCMACGLTVVPVLWRLLHPHAVTGVETDPDISPDGLRLTAELTAEGVRRMRRRMALNLNTTTAAEQPPEQDDAWDESQPLILHPDALESSRTGLTPEFRAALAVRAGQVLASAAGENNVSILLQPVPPWRYSWWRIRRWLIIAGAGFAAVLALCYALPGGVPAAGVILLTVLPLGALTSFKLSQQPAFQLVSPGPGALVPLYAWLPVSARELWRGFRARERRSQMSGVLYAALLAAALWVLSATIVAGFRAASLVPPEPVTSAASVYGSGSALQSAAFMAALLHVLRSTAPLRFATSALRNFRFFGWWAFPRVLFALLCLFAVAASIVALATGVGAAAVAVEKPRYLWFCLYSLGVSEVFRMLAGELMLVLAVRARGEFSAGRTQ